MSRFLTGTRQFPGDRRKVLVSQLARRVHLKHMPIGLHAQDWIWQLIRRGKEGRV